jgi:2-polyprenyl-6-methoxyphenol hydroxylase-like FAD-dependent oxidoreductase
MKAERYDIVIAGGGMIGASLALALAPLGLRVAVVEAVARQDAAQPSFDDRSTALSRSTHRMFEAMGLWDEIVAASTPILSIHVSDQGRFGFSHIDADEQGVEALGYVVINRVLGEVLQRALDKRSRGAPPDLLPADRRRWREFHGTRHDGHCGGEEPLRSAGRYRQPDAGETDQ